MAREKNIVTFVILTLVTCGIYGLVWMANITDDMKTSGGDFATSGGTVVLFQIITCGLYGYYWAYKMGKSLSVIKENRNIAKEDNSVLYLILQLLQFGAIINLCLMQNELNNFTKQGN